jgi:hypothetical protein
MKKHLSLTERIRNADASQQVENVKARHSFLHARCDATTEWTELWSESDERGWSHFFGCMYGRDQVWYGLVGDYDAMAFQKWLDTRDIYPELIGKDPRPLMECSVHTLVNDVVEVADDGMSARASYYTPGCIHSVLNADKRKFCGVLWERYGADFVYERGGWKYLNEQVGPDIPAELDRGNWAADNYAELTGVKEPWKPPEGGSGPPPTSFPGWHKPYTAIQPPQYDTPWPEPYKTMTRELRYNKPGVGGKIE